MASNSISSMVMEVTLKPWAKGYLTRVREAAQASGRCVSAKELGAHLTFVVRMDGLQFKVGGKNA